MYFATDPERVRTDGFDAMSAFLKKLHILKCIGDFDSAKTFFEAYM